MPPSPSSPAVFRTFLFTPGIQPRRIEKAFTLDADAVILDLEDAVAVQEKPAARPLVTEALARPRPPGAPAGYVRINALTTPFAFADLHAVVAPGVDGIVLPKLESPEELHTADWMVTQLERERGLPENAIDLMPILETGLGLARIDALARAAAATPRVRRLSFGAGDFVLDVNLVWSAEEWELQPYRSQVVLASRAAGLEPPIDTVWARLDDADGFARSAARVQAMGFQGKLCIHPAQVPVANAAFSPSEAEVARARAVVAAFAEAEAAGVASIQLDGQFIDYPIVHRARRTIDLADRIRT